jgi:hypothetical protein
LKKHMNRIVWMSDELMATTRPEDWEVVSAKSKELFSLIGNAGFTHDVVSPQDCVIPLAHKLAGKKFSIIIDLTEGGWLSDSFRNLFPATPVSTDLHISRVRNVSDPTLPTSGHIINLNRNRIESLKRRFDFSSPLILDDVSFSGASSELTMNLFGINPQNASNGFLITNIGELGPNHGAKSKLEALGSKVFSGQTLNTSEGEDGWHIKDFVEHPFLERSLGLIVTIHEIIQNDGKDSEILRRLFATEALKGILFPFALPIDKLISLSREGQFKLPEGRDIGSLASGMHTTNPTLLTSPAFLAHIDSGKFNKNLNHVSRIIREIQLLTKDREAQRESTRQLRNEIERGLFNGNIERK